MENLNLEKTVTTEERKEKDKWKALIFCIIGGFFGAHKFYENKIITGILYCILGTVCFDSKILMLFIAFDAIRILMKPNPYYIIEKYDF